MPSNITSVVMRGLDTVQESIEHESSTLIRVLGAQEERQMQTRQQTQERARLEEDLLVWQGKMAGLLDRMNEAREECAALWGRVAGLKGFKGEQGQQSLREWVEDARGEDEDLWGPPLVEGEELEEGEIREEPQQQEQQQQAVNQAEIVVAANANAANAAAALQEAEVRMDQDAPAAFDANAMVMAIDAAYITAVAQAAVNVDPNAMDEEQPLQDDAMDADAPADTLEDMLVVLNGAALAAAIVKEQDTDVDDLMDAILPDALNIAADYDEVPEPLLLVDIKMEEDAEEALIKMEEDADEALIKMEEDAGEALINDAVMAW